MSKIKVEYTVKVNTDYGYEHKQRTKTLDIKPCINSMGWILMEDTLKCAELYLKENVIPGISNVSAWWVRNISIV